MFDEINKIEYPKKGTGYYSKNESKIIPRQLFQHAEQLSDVDAYIKTQLRQTKNITRTHPPQISALFFRDYKRLIHILDDVVSFTGSEAQQSHSIKLGSIIYLENSGVVCSNKIGDITKISANHEPEMISHLFYRSFLFRKVKNINIFNSRFGIYIVKQISKAFNSHFSVVFYFTISNEDDFIEKFGPDILHLIRLGVPANNIRLSSHLYKKFLSIYSEQWKESICEFSGS